MNSRDRTNLEFLMGCSTKDFEEWLDHASQEDVDYALELIRLGKAETMLEEMELAEVMYSCDDDMTDAREVLARFKLK